MPDDEDELLHNTQQFYIKNMLNLKPRNKMSKTELLLLLAILKSLKSKVEKRMKYLNVNGYMEGSSEI
jgi:hypothetical protein